MPKSKFCPIAILILSAYAAGCTNRAPSLRMLDTRAEYENPRAVHELVMKEGGLEGFRNHPLPTRTRPKVAAIWVHPHEMASRDYFWGGWMSCVIEEDRWILSRPGQMPDASGITDVTQNSPGGVAKKSAPHSKRAQPLRTPTPTQR